MARKIIEYNKTDIYVKIASLLLKTLVLVVLLAILGGVVKTFLGLSMLFDASVEEALTHTMVNVATIFALVELLRTGLIYLREGRVRVTFIIDTVLIIMLKEIIIYWFSETKEIQSFYLLLAIIFILMCARIMSIRFSSDRD